MLSLILILYLYTVALTVIFIGINNMVYQNKINELWAFASFILIIYLIIKEYRKQPEKENKMKVNNDIEFIDECS